MLKIMLLKFGMSRARGFVVREAGSPLLPEGEGGTPLYKLHRYVSP